MIALLLSLSLALGADVHSSATLVVKVAKVESAIQTVLDKNKQLGGWFQSLDDSSLNLRVPTENSDALLGFVEEQGILVQRDYSTTDLREQLANARARVQSREKLLADYQAMLAKADRKTVVSLQSEIANVINQVEGLKGRIRYLEDQAAWAHVSVSFAFRDRTAPNRGGVSSFSWLNLELPSLTDAFQYGRGAQGPRGERPLAPLDGFVGYRLKGEYRAVSSDGVMVRMRAVKQKPKADLDFWKEALKNRMVEAGYTVLSEATPAGSYVLELGAPFGAEDWRYLVAIHPQGSRIQIVEAAGPEARFLARRAALDPILK